MSPPTSNLETLDRAIEYYAEHANGRGGTAWMNPATVLETLALLRELKHARPAAQSWESYEAAQERKETSGETGADGCCPCCGRSIAVHDNADRLRSALKATTCGWGGAYGRCVLEPDHDGPHDIPRHPKTPADPAPYTIDKGEPLC